MSERIESAPTEEELKSVFAAPKTEAEPATQQQNTSSQGGPTADELKSIFAQPSAAKVATAPETSAQQDAGQKWAEEHPIAGRALSALHGAGEIIPGREKLSAGLHALTDFGEGSFGEKYERAKKAQERAGKALSEAYPGAHFAGEIAPMLTPVGAETFAAGEGLVGKGIGKALPFLGETGRKVAGVSGFGGLYGAAQGAAEGDTAEERIKNAISGGTLGAAIGPAASGIGAVGRSIFGPAGKSATQEAAERLGPEISEVAPRFITSEAPVQKTISAGLQAIPYVGDKLRAASNELNSALGKKIFSIASSPQANPELAGNKVRTGIEKWIGEDSKKTVSDLYGGIQKAFDQFAYENKFPQGARGMHELPATSEIYDKLLKSNMQSANPQPITGAMGQISEAITRPEGMNFPGLLDLRRRIGDLMKDRDALVAQKIDGAELKRIYGAVSEDLKSAALREGGPNALRALHNAERGYDIIREKRKLFRKIIGAGDRYSDEQVLDNLANMVKENRGDLKRLSLVKENLAPNDWNQVVSEMVHRLGKQDDELGKGFSPAKFLTSYSKMAPRARDIVFGPPGTGYRQNIDDIAKMALAAVKAGEGVNTSKTAHVNETLKMFDKVGLAGKAALGLGVAGAAAEGAHQAKEGDWGSLATELGGGYMLASLLASPRGSFAVKEWMKNGSPSAGKALTDEISRIMGRAPKATQYATQTTLTKNMANREERASGGKVGNRDYPAKKLTRVEKALKRAQDALSLESKPLMSEPDEQIAQALRIAEKK